MDQICAKLNLLPLHPVIGVEFDYTLAARGFFLFPNNIRPSEHNEQSAVSPQGTRDYL